MIGAAADGVDENVDRAELLCHRGGDGVDLGGVEHVGYVLPCARPPEERSAPTVSSSRPSSMSTATYDGTLPGPTLRRRWRGRSRSPSAVMIATRSVKRILSSCFAMFRHSRESGSRGGRPRRLPPVQARGRLWIPAFAAATRISAMSQLFGVMATLPVRSNNLTRVWVSWSAPCSLITVWNNSRTTLAKTRWRRPDRAWSQAARPCASTPR